MIQRNEPGSEHEAVETDSVGLLRLARDGRIVSLNPAAERQFAVEAPDWIGRRVQDLGGDVLSPGPFSDFESLLPVEDGYRELELEAQVRGEVRALRSRLLLQGECVLLLCEDGGERSQAESRFRAILGSSRDGVVVLDESGTIIWPNSRFGHLFGLHWRQFKGMRFRTAIDLISECFTHPSQLMGYLREVEEGPESHHETILEVSWPEPLVLQVTSRPISNEKGRNIGWVWNFGDITKFKSLENQLREINQDLERRVGERTQELQARYTELETARRSLEKANQALELELDMAKQVQDGLLPERLPSLDGWKLHAEYMPTGKVGGDFFDVVDLGDGTAFVLMADVAGHGVSAALVTAMAKMSFLRAVRATPDFSVAEILRQVNADLFKAIRTDHYLTAFAGHLDIASGRMRYSRVCHPYPFVIRANGDSERITQRGGFFVGMFEKTPYEEGVLELGHGDLLFLYTDGLNESTDPRGRQFGMHRLEAALLSSHMDGPAAAVHNALAQREGHACGRSPNDDITVLALQRL